jgi:hypothetical protein
MPRVDRTRHGQVVDGSMIHGARLLMTMIPAHGENRMLTGTA